MFVEMYSETQTQCVGKTKFGGQCKKMTTTKYCFQHQKLLNKKKSNSKLNKSVTKATTSPVLQSLNIPCTLPLPFSFPQPQTILNFATFEDQPRHLLNSVSLGSLDSYNFNVSDSESEDEVEFRNLLN
eukprot:Pgem_evm1s8396